MKRVFLLPGLLAASLSGVVSASQPASPGLAQQRLEARHTPPGFVYVPGGKCVLGTDDPDADDDARPSRHAFVPSFYLGRTEVTHAEWQRFRPEHVIPEGMAAYPITDVRVDEAAAYCKWAGGRLPADAEWEKAARGPDGRRYPWGSAFDALRCNVRESRRGLGARCRPQGPKRGLQPADTHPEGASPYGALNMAGNAWEWVADAYQGDPNRRIIRGGASGYGERAARTYHRALEGAGVT